MEAAGWKLQGVNWIYEKVTGENLIEALITPLVGDFEKIDANANAWDQVAKALDSVRHNVDEGAGQLRRTGTVTRPRRSSRAWAPCGSSPSRRTPRSPGSSATSSSPPQRVPYGDELALSLLDMLVSKLIEAAMTAWIPVVGWGRAVWMVYDAIQIVDAIRKIILSIMTLIEGVKGMVDGIVAMGTALMKLKDVGRQRPARRGRRVQDGKQKFDNGKSAAKSGAIGVGLGAYSLGKAGSAASGRFRPAAARRARAPAPAPVEVVSSDVSVRPGAVAGVVLRRGQPWRTSSRPRGRRARCSCGRAG